MNPREGWMRHRWLAVSLATAGIILAALGAIQSNLRALEASRVLEYRKLADQVGKLAVGYSALKQYDQLLDLMQLLAQTPMVRFMALEVNGTKVLQAGQAPRPEAAGKSAGFSMVWIPLDPGAARLQAQSGLRIFFSLEDLRERRRAIFWISGLIAFLWVVLLALLHVLDRTRRKLKRQNAALIQAQEQLRQEEATRSLMARYLAHNANNLLNVVAVRLANLRAKQAAGQGGTVSEKELAVLDENQKAIGYLIRNLYDYDRLKRGELPVNPRPEDLAELLRRSARSAETLASEKNIRVLSGGLESLVLSVDAGLVEQVVMNLLVNAVRYSPPDSSVQLELEAGPGQAEVRVRDQGRGIAREDWEKIFEPFVRLQTDGPKGSGLGLANARLLLKQLGGRIWVKESLPGAGTTLAFTLPVSGLKKSSEGQSA